MCKPRSLCYCFRLKKRKQAKIYIIYKLSGLMLMISLAGFLIAKLGGFLQLACWILCPARLWPACLFLGFCFQEVRSQTPMHYAEVFCSRRNQGKSWFLLTKFFICLSLLFHFSQYQSRPSSALSFHKLFTVCHQ